LLPGVREPPAVDSAIRGTAALVDQARADGHDVCGRSTEALIVYTSPLTFPGALPGEGCDVLVTVFGLSTAEVDLVTAAYGGRVDLGESMILWAPPDIIQSLELER